MGILLVIIAMVAGATPLILKKNNSNKNYYTETADTAKDKIQNPPEGAQNSDEALNPTGSSSSLEQTDTQQKEAPAASQTENNQSTINKASLKIKVLNGTKISGLAAQTKTTLENEGFEVESIGNAKNSYQTSYIYYKDGVDEGAKLVKDTLTGRDWKLESNNDLATRYAVDILVVLGLK